MTDTQVQEPKTVDGLDAYDVIRKVGDKLPYGLRLPRARSMTQAKIDYDFRKHAIVKWYNQNQTVMTNNEIL